MMDEGRMWGGGIGVVGLDWLFYVHGMCPIYGKGSAVSGGMNFQWG